MIGASIRSWLVAANLPVQAMVDEVRPSAANRPPWGRRHSVQLGPSFGGVPRQLRPGQDLNTKIRAFSDGWNDRCQPFVWTKTADQRTDRPSPDLVVID